MLLEPARPNHCMQPQMLGSPISAEWPFPIELCRHIFSDCSPEDLAKISLVSRIFCQLANDEELWCMFVSKLNLPICETKKEGISWKEFYKIQDYERYAKGKTLNVCYLKLDFWGVFQPQDPIKIEIDVNSPNVKGRHLKQAIKKTNGLTHQLNQISVSLFFGGILTLIEDYSSLNSYNLQENSSLSYSLL